MKKKKEKLINWILSGDGIDTFILLTRKREGKFNGGNLSRVMSHIGYLIPKLST